MGLKSWVKKKARKAKKGVEHTANEAKKGVEHVANEAKDAVTDAAREAEKGVNAAIDKLDEETRGRVMSIIDDVRKLVKEATSENGPIWKLRHETWDKLTSLKNNLVGEIEAKGEEAIGKVDKAMTEKLPELVTDTLPGVLKNVLNAISNESMKPALKGAAKAARSTHKKMAKLADDKPDLIDAINGWSRSIDLQAVACLGLSYENFYDRALEVAGVLDRYANEGIKARRRDIIGFFRATGPTTVSYGAGGELSLGIQIGASYTESMPLAVFLEIADEALAELGVPE